MTTDNLWGKLPEEDHTESPNAILEAQGYILEAATSGRLRGRLRRAVVDEQIVIDFSVVAPQVNNFQVTLIRAIHGAIMYPVRVYDLLGDPNGAAVICDDSKLLKSYLANILQSPEVKRVISSLLGQSPPLTI